jgi:hypothetical protein
MAKKNGAKRPIHLPAIATRKRRRAKTVARRNPDGGGLIENAKDAFFSSGMVHAVGGYAGSRLVGRIMRRMIAKKYPALANHATPLGNLLAAVALYFITKKWKKVVREEAMIGSVIAVAQAILQAYMPGLAAVFMDSDAGLETAARSAVAAPAPQNGLGAYQAGRRRRKFVLPGEVEAERTEAAREAPTGPVQYVNPGMPGSGYGTSSRGDEFEDATADIPAAGDDDGLGDDLGIFQQP